MPWDLTDNKSTLFQVTAWCRETTSHYLSQCWPSSMSPDGVTRPQLVKTRFVWISYIAKLPASHKEPWYWSCDTAIFLFFLKVGRNNTILYSVKGCRKFRINIFSKHVLIGQLLHWQITPASSVWAQLWFPHPWLKQSASRVSCPVHCTLSSQMEPLPLPKWAQDTASPPEYPNCRHTTAASTFSHLK